MEERGDKLVALRLVNLQVLDGTAASRYSAAKRRRRHRFIYST